MSQLHIPTAPDIHEAKHILEALQQDVTRVSVELDGQHFTLPHGLVSMFRELLTNTANGEAITITSINTNLSSQDAASYLHVSRQFLVNEAEAGRIPYRKIGTHRRFAFTDILEYQRLIESESLVARQALADEAQALGLD